VFEQGSPDDDTHSIVKKVYQLVVLASLLTMMMGYVNLLNLCLILSKRHQPAMRKRFDMKGWLSQSTSLSEIATIFVVPAGIQRKDALMSSRSLMMDKFLFLVHMLLVVLVGMGSLFLLS
jgi:hypothetical protein